jgi:hypothetical protein
MTEDEDRKRHREAFEKMLGLVLSTVKSLKDQQKSSTAKKDVALRRWAMYLGLLMVNVGKSVARLIDTEDVTAIAILCRSIYEYRVKTEFFLHDAKTQELALQQYLTIPTAYRRQLKRMPTTTDEIEKQLDAMFEAWIKQGGAKDIYSGSKGLTKMALALAGKKEILKDENGEEYTHALAVSYGHPSWFAHGDAPLIAEFFPEWMKDDNWDYVEEPSSSGALSTIRGSIGDVFTYLVHVRRHYDIPLIPVQVAMRRALELSPSIGYRARDLTFKDLHKK